MYLKRNFSTFFTNNKFKMKMSLILILLNVFYIISLVESHGFLVEPLPRHFISYLSPEVPHYKKDPSALYCGTFDHQYYYNGL